MINFHFRLRKRNIRENIKAFGFWRGMKRKSDDIIASGEYITNGTINIILPVFKEIFMDDCIYQGKKLEKILTKEISKVIFHEYLHYTLLEKTGIPLNKHHFIIDKMIEG